MRRIFELLPLNALTSLWIVIHFLSSFRTPNKMVVNQKYLITRMFIFHSVYNIAKNNKRSRQFISTNKLGGFLAWDFITFSPPLSLWYRIACLLLLTSFPNTPYYRCYSFFYYTQKMKVSSLTLSFDLTRPLDKCFLFTIMIVDYRILGHAW